MIVNVIELGADLYGYRVRLKGNLTLTHEDGGEMRVDEIISITGSANIAGHNHATDYQRGLRAVD